MRSEVDLLAAPRRLLVFRLFCVTFGILFVGINFFAIISVGLSRERRGGADAEFEPGVDYPCQ
jgi:hypothetical protein